MDIIRTDNAIYKQLKVLFEYKAYQQTHERQPQASDGSKIGYLNTINKLRQDNERLKAAAARQENSGGSPTLVIILLVLILASILFLLAKNRKPAA